MTIKMPIDCSPGSSKFAEANKRYIESMGFGVGSKVRRGKGKGIRTVIAIYGDVWGGVVLDKDTDGFHSWNIEELERVEICET